MSERWVSRSGWALAVLLPLWGLWAYSWSTLEAVDAWMEQVPRYYGVHLCREQARGQLELFARVVDLFERGEFRTRLAYLDQKYQRGEIGQMAALFGLGHPLLVVQRPTFEVLYPARPGGPLAPLLDNPAAREALVESLRRMAGRGEKEGVFSMPGGGAGPHPADGHWHLSVAYSGGDLLCVLLVPEETVLRAGQTLETAQSDRFRERLHRYLLITVPFLSLVSLLTVLLVLRMPARGGPRGPEKGS